MTQKTEIFWNSQINMLVMFRITEGPESSGSTSRYSKSGAEMFPFAQRYIPRLHSLMVIHES